MHICGAVGIRPALGLCRNSSTDTRAMLSCIYHNSVVHKAKYFSTWLYTTAVRMCKLMAVSCSSADSEMRNDMCCSLCTSIELITAQCACTKATLQNTPKVHIYCIYYSSILSVHPQIASFSYSGASQVHMKP
jgi:hypothetical protein